MRARHVLAAAGAVAITALFFRYVPLHDFVEYWTAAHALASHHNPYSVADMLPLQRALGWSEPEPLVVMSPPHFLPLLMPLALLHSYSLARLLWLVVSAGMFVLECFALWRLYGGCERQKWISVGVAALFFPVWHCLAVAQIGPLLLLGIVGFLWLERRGHLFLAGAALALTTFKPHLFYLVWLALLLWSVQRRGFRVLLGAAAAIGIGMAVALLLDPAALSQYATLVRSDYVWKYNSGLGGVLRGLLQDQSHALQFLPMLPGLAALAWYWRKYRLAWHWSDRLPLLVTVSVLTAAYGWPFDEVVLLVALLPVAVQCTSLPLMRKPAAAWLLGNFAASLGFVLRYGDAAGMTVCAAGVLGYYIFAASRAGAEYQPGTLQETCSQP